MSVTSVLAFSIEISGQWKLIICRIPSGPQVVEILPSGRKTIYKNISSKRNILQMSLLPCWCRKIIPHLLKLLPSDTSSLGQVL